MKKKEFDRLMERYLTGKATEREKKKIEAWLDVAKTDDDTGTLTPEAEDRLLRNITGKIPRQGRPAVTRQNTRAVRRTRVLATWAVMAVVATSATWYFLGREERGINEPALVKKIILDDGSLVWLKGDSELSYHEGAEGVRYGELQGEALFEIAKDPLRPFVVKCGVVNITVRGTSFNVRAGPGALELKVLTGKVDVSSGLNTEVIEVMAHEQLTYPAAGKAEKRTLAAADMESLAANTTYRMTFRDASVGEVIARLEQKFDVQIGLGNEAIRECRITADFTDQSLAQALRMITQVLDVSLTTTGKQFVLDGEGCR